MFREEKKWMSMVFCKGFFYFEYFPVWAAKEWPNIQLAEDYLIRKWIFMFKELDQHPFNNSKFCNGRF